MGNERNIALYKDVLNSFQSLSSGNHPSNLEVTLSRGYHLFLGGYTPSELPSSDFGASNLQKMVEYCHLISSRRKIVIEGGEREVTTEPEVYRALLLATDLARDIVIPNFDTKNDFSNKLFKDIYNLGLAYLHAIVSAVAQEYVGREETSEAKKRAVRIASKGIRVHDLYDEHGFNKKLIHCMKSLTRRLARAQSEYMRSFELAPTSQKKIYKGEELMKQLAEEVTQLNSSGGFVFKPSVIFPIAQGGNELGLRISNAYEDKGYGPEVYPLLYSIKTRKHRDPWTTNDSGVLNTDLEGKDLLVTEDWVTTGNTLRGILTEIERCYPHETRVATIKRDPEKSKIPILNKFHFYVGNWTEYRGGKTDTLRNNRGNTQ